MKQQRHKFKFIVLLIACMLCGSGYAQQNIGATNSYKKRVLETTEVDFLSSYYSQNGDNAAVTGGIGTEELTDVTGTIIVSVPLNDDDILTIDAGVSAYTSASSSNVDPFDGSERADAFVASTGASRSDVWTNLSGTYTHSSDDRNTMYSGNLSVSSEYDYFSFGFGGGLTKLFNEKNTEVSINANIFLDTWTPIYPTELRPFASGANGLDNGFFLNKTITGNTDYSPTFEKFTDETRNSYSVGLGFSQILGKNLQGSLALDFVKQDGLLSTPFQRVYFADIADSFIQEFQLADAIEQLPDSRFKVAGGGRLNWYINESVVLRSYYRYYFDDWGINSHTASVEMPIKLTDKFTVYPSYRFYQQSAADYFFGYEEAFSTDTFYTSDYDLSKYSANQFGMGVSYTDIFTKMHVWKLGLKSIDVKFYKYDRNTTFSSSILTAGFKFVMD
ncbi:Protein of unknown function [Maribacter dokdonensis]|uniref:DUF3570 domain-containing protein n=2 Tax=Maribacter dokdonensis TaxID=320912 RepID=A0A1H4U6F4_9FLAO|nr:Protein of unknown function [Maribacter dokdonensis]